MELSARLRSVADEVDQGSRLADIGTDHGYIPIFLVKNGTVPFAIASDVKEGPLFRARENIKENGLLDRIEVRLLDGLLGICPDEIDCIVIAGMGGSLMAKILSGGRGALSGGKTLVLQPQSEIFKVRRWLHCNGYRIMREKIVKEGTKFYFIIKAVPGMERFGEEAFYRYGMFLLEEKNPVMEEYLKKEWEKYSLILEKLMQKPSGAAKKRREEIKEEISWIKKALDIYQI